MLSDTLIFINVGRMHPIMVHLPIGMLLLTFLLEIANRYWKKNHFIDAIQLGLVCSFLSSLLSIGSGLLIANEGGYGIEALSNHKYAGIAFSISSFFLIIAHRSRYSFVSRSYFPVFIISVILLLLTGHLGGNLTHGSNYLFEKSSEAAINIVDINEALSYEDLIKPIFDNKCNGCHNPSKLKGDLLMTNPQGLSAGGKNGKIFNLENPSKSEILIRIHLPQNVEEHMPPDGRHQLIEDEIKLLSWWVGNKACYDCKVGDMTNNENVAAILDKYTILSDETTKPAIGAIKEKVLARIKGQGARIELVHPDENYVSVSYLNNTELSSSHIKSLSKIRHHITELNFSGSSLTSSLFKKLPQLPNLQKLQLQRTDIKDGIGSKINQFASLQSLNLYQTAITDQTLSAIQNLKTLRNLYLFQSKVTDQGVMDLSEKMPLLDIQYKIDKSIFGDGSLMGPTFDIEADLFVDTILIPLVSSFRNVTIHYTTDGSDPDSTSVLYDAPLRLHETTLIRAICRKKGWQDSPISEKQYIRTNKKAKSAKLQRNPDSRYAGRGAETIIDLVKGSEDFRDGNWIGYEAEHINATLELENPSSIENIYVSTFSEPGSWIFHPKSVSVSLSEDGENYGVSQSILTGLDHRMGKEIIYIEVPIKAEQIRFIKVQIENIMKNPEWHPNSGGRSWLFIDEIMIN